MHPDDIDRLDRRYDDERERDYRAELRRDRLADYAPAPDPVSPADPRVVEVDRLLRGSELLAEEAGRLMDEIREGRAA